MENVQEEIDKLEQRKQNKKAKWINNIGKGLQGFERPEVDIHQESLRETPKKIPNRKTPGLGGLLVIWLQNSHLSKALELSGCVEAGISTWMTKRKTTLIHKDPRKGTIPHNYRPINRNRAD